MVSGKKMMRRLVASLAIISALDVFFLLVLPCGRMIPPFRTVGEERYAAAAVLFHDFNATRDGLSNESKRRVAHAVVLFRTGRVAHLIMAGGSRPDENLYGSLFMADFAAEAGVDRERIIVETQSRDTFSNVAGIEEIAASRKWNSLVFVSSPLHLRRLAITLAGRLPVGTGLSSYSYEDSVPAPSRAEIWRAAHHESAALLGWALLPTSWYRAVVDWLRANTCI